MIKATCKLVSKSPYSQSAHHDTPKLEKESSKDYEKRTWQRQEWFKLVGWQGSAWQGSAGHGKTTQRKGFCVIVGWEMIYLNEIDPFAAEWTNSVRCLRMRGESTKG